MRSALQSLASLFGLVLTAPPLDKIVAHSDGWGYAVAEAMKKNNDIGWGSSYQSTEVI